MAVDENCRGKGVGKSVVLELERMAKEKTEAGNTINGEAIVVKEEPATPEFDLSKYRLSIHGSKGKKVMASFEEARNLLAAKMQGFTTRHDRQRIIDENKELLTAMDKQDIGLSTKLYELRNEGV
jgi:hypothetical protein